tara:strand:+ start:1328 stop:1789 length:462 start_codon:yes stop_codon:yes gene_type:complete
MFDQSRKKERFSFYGEAVRLSNEIRAMPAHTIINYMGKKENVPFKNGFDIETCSILQIKQWLNDKTIKKSESLLTFVHRIFSVRFPTEYNRLKDTIDSRFKREHERIQSESKNEIEWFGETGINNMVRLDGSLDNPKAKVFKLRNDKWKIKRV